MKSRQEPVPKTLNLFPQNKKTQTQSVKENPGFPGPNAHLEANSTGITTVFVEERMRHSNPILKWKHPGASGFLRFNLIL